MTAILREVASTPGWRVLVLDDSIAVGSAVRAMLVGMPQVGEVETAGCAGSALAILRAKSRAAPVDVVLLDVEMPAMSGIEALPRRLRASPTTRVVMASSLTRRGATATMAALVAGASDHLCKPSALAGRAPSVFADELAAKIAAWAAHARRQRASAAHRALVPWPTAGPPSETAFEDPGPTGPGAKARPASPGELPASDERPSRLERPAGRRPENRQVDGMPPRDGPLRPFRALAIGSSTGGPQALMQLLRSFAKPLCSPVLITQHMPPAFTAMLAEQIGRLTGAVCGEAADSEVVAAWRVDVAPGDHRLLVEHADGKRPTLRLSRAAPENIRRPALDPMLRSLATTYRDGLCALIRTGMGQDGQMG